jgi:hypothetical protein
MLHRDTPWVLSVNSMTALECICRGVGPHTIDIANFLVTHGVRFRALQLISESPDSPTLLKRPRCQYLGYRSVNYTFDLADYAGYEALRDFFLRSQPYGPLALREGGIIARLAREVLPNSDALSGPSSEALSGHRARFVCNDQIYVEDEFSEAELGLICGTYVLSTNAGGMISFNYAFINLIFFQFRQSMSHGFRCQTSGMHVGSTLASGRKSVKSGSRSTSQKSRMVAFNLFLRKTGAVTFATLGWL